MSSESGPRKLSRREFTAVPASLAGATLTGFAQSAPLTGGQVIERIKEHLGVPWRGGPTDTLKTGDDHTPVTGVATTVMSTFDVIKRAAAARKNMVITHEPTFWTHNDDQKPFEADAVYQQKMQFIRFSLLIGVSFREQRQRRCSFMFPCPTARGVRWGGTAGVTSNGDLLKRSIDVLRTALRKDSTQTPHRNSLRRGASQKCDFRGLFVAM